MDSDLFFDALKRVNPMETKLTEDGATNIFLGHTIGDTVFVINAQNAIDIRKVAGIVVNLSKGQFKTRVYLENHEGSAGTDPNNIYATLPAAQEAQIQWGYKQVIKEGSTIYFQSSVKGKTTRLKWEDHGYWGRH